MDDQDREQFERDLAVAVLALWLLFESIRTVRFVDFQEFGALFSQHVKPILSKVYGLARYTLASAHGVNYRSRPDGNGGNIVTIPDLNTQLARYQRTIYDAFNNRWTNNQPAQTPTSSQPSPPSSQPSQRQGATRTAGTQAGTQVIDAPNEVELEEDLPDPVLVRTGPAEVPFETHDAERIAITTITDATSQGENDAARDIEARTGTRLVPIWKTEPGACDVCGPLEGKGREVWGTRFPNGPSAHPRCRCVLIWRPRL